MHCTCCCYMAITENIKYQIYPTYCCYGNHRYAWVTATCFYSNHRQLGLGAIATTEILLWYTLHPHWWWEYQWTSRFLEEVTNHGEWLLWLRTHAWIVPCCYISLHVVSLQQVYIPAKPLHNCDIVSVHFNHFHCMGICRQTKKALIYVNLHISQHGWVLINIFYAPGKG